MSRSAFEQSRDKERRALQQIMPFLIEQSDGGLVIPVNAKNPLGLFVQKNWGDFILSAGRTLVTFEHKADANDTNRICVEVWSNFIAGDYPSYLERGHKPGWALTSRAMILGYHWYHSDRLILIDLYALQQWAFGPMHGAATNIERHQFDGREEMAVFPYRRPLANQPNATWVRWVPLPVLHRELKPRPIEVNVRQLYLDLGDRAPPFETFAA
ncbi:MAG TPA: hypothetical protein VLN57_14485 [Xanthobacteraceae bacterium]|nr:hypothetical protein [Xanthobacteraceae bacterium]